MQPRPSSLKFPRMRGLNERCMGHRKAQKQILRVLEKLAADEASPLDGPRASRVRAELAPLLQALYEADVLDEAAIMSWAAKTTALAREAAEPMLRWLREAEEEESEESD